jgi:hypothetical protein
MRAYFYPLNDTATAKEFALRSYVSNHSHSLTRTLSRTEIAWLALRAACPVRFLHLCDDVGCCCDVSDVLFLTWTVSGSATYLRMWRRWHCSHRRNGAGALCILQCSSLCDSYDADCCCDADALVATTTTIIDDNYAQQGNFPGYWGYNYSAHSVQFVAAATTLPKPPDSVNYTRTFTYKVCMTANNGESRRAHRMDPTLAVKHDDSSSAGDAHQEEGAIL